MAILERPAAAVGWRGPLGPGTSRNDAPARHLAGALHYAAVLALLLAAAFVRLAHLSDVQFRHDDDVLWRLATTMARTGTPAATGMISSAGFPNGPLQVWLLAPLAWLGASPPAMTAGVALLNVLAVALTYGFARDFFGKRVALLSLLLVAINPWAAMLSRRLWGNDMVAPFAAVTLWMLARWLFRRDGRALVVAAIALAVVNQLYVVGLEALATAAMAAILAGRRLLSRWVAMAALAYCVVAAPYLVGVVIPSAAGAASRVQGAAGSRPVTDLRSVTYALELASNEGYQAFALQASGRLDAASGVALSLGMLQRALYLGGLAIGVATVVRDRGRLRSERPGVHLLMLTAVVVPVASLARHALPLYPYYFVITFPLPYVYGAVAVDTLWTWGAKLPAALATVARAASVGALGAIVALQIALTVVFLSVEGAYFERGNYGLPWRLTDRLISDARQLERERGATRVLVPGFSQDTRDLREAVAGGGSDDALIDDRRMVVVPGTPAIYLTLGDSRTVRALTASYSQFMVRDQVLPGDGTRARLFAFPRSSGPSLSPRALRLNWTLGGLIRLDGVELPRRLTPGQAFTVTAYATALTRPEPSVPNFSLFAHLTRQDGVAVAQRDDATWDTEFWRSGDTIVQWLDLRIPPDARPGLLSLALGMYSTGTPSHRGVFPLAVTDSGGRSLGTTGRVDAAVIAPAAPAAPAYVVSAELAGGIALEGYDVERSGRQLAITPHWSASAAPARDYTSFVHVLDATGALVAQRDSPPRDGEFPTSYWQPGDHVADRKVIDLPDGLPAGTYTLEFGLYDPRTLGRLPVVAGRVEASISL